MQLLKRATTLSVMSVSRYRLWVTATLAAVALTVGSLLLFPHVARAQLERPQTDLMVKEAQTKVITVGDMVDRGLFSIAREVFDHEATLRIGQGPVETKPRGFEFLIFNPGVGVTVRYRW
jgi:hypothetical protein